MEKGSHKVPFRYNHTNGGFRVAYIPRTTTVRKAHQSTPSKGGQMQSMRDSALCKHSFACRTENDSEADVALLRLRLVSVLYKQWQWRARGPGRPHAGARELRAGRELRHTAADRSFRTELGQAFSTPQAPLVSIAQFACALRLGNQLPMNRVFAAAVTMRERLGHRLRSATCGGRLEFCCVLCRN